jgi:PPM family protein phosphatase
MRIREDVELANISDVGCVRTENEDYFLYMEPDSDSDFARRGRLVVLTDGMGGHAGGEVASRLAAGAVRDVFLSGEPADPRDVLIEAFRAAHQAILDEANRQPELRGMGATCCAVIYRLGGRLHYGHVGDSRIYLIRAGKAQRLTEDHSVVARMVREGILTEEQAARDERRNVLTAALGVESDSLSAEFALEPLQLAENDIVLLCSDGLHGQLSDEEIGLTTEGQSLGEACRELVARAKVRGGPDNITLQMMAVRRVDA